LTGYLDRRQKKKSFGKSMSFDAATCVSRACSTWHWW